MFHNVLNRVKMQRRVKYPERLTEMKTSGTKDVSGLVTSAEEEGEL